MNRWIFALFFLIIIVLTLSFYIFFLRFDHNNVLKTQSLTQTVIMNKTIILNLYNPKIDNLYFLDLYYSVEAGNSLIIRNGSAIVNLSKNHTIFKINLGSNVLNNIKLNFHTVKFRIFNNSYKTDINENVSINNSDTGNVFLINIWGSFLEFYKTNTTIFKYTQYINATNLQINTSAINNTTYKAGNNTLAINNFSVMMKNGDILMNFRVKNNLNRNIFLYNVYLSGFMGFEIPIMHINNTLNGNNSKYHINTQNNVYTNIITPIVFGGPTLGIGPNDQNINSSSKTLAPSFTNDTKNFTKIYGDMIDFIINNSGTLIVPYQNITYLGNYSLPAHTDRVLTFKNNLALYKNICSTSQIDCNMYSSFNITLIRNHSYVINVYGSNGSYGKSIFYYT